MKRPLTVVALFACLFFTFNGYLFASDPYGALVIIKSYCTFKARPAGSVEPFGVFERNTNGVGFFVSHGKKNSTNFFSEFVVTAGHVVNCNISPSLDFRGLEVQDFKTDSIFIYHSDREYQAEIVKSSDSQRYFKYPDEALLMTLLPRSLAHYHLKLADSGDKYKIGDKVTIKAFFVLSAQKNNIKDWRTIYLESHIAFFNDNFIHLSVPVYFGMSGSPVILWKKKFLWWGRKPVVIGIVSLSEMIDGYILSSSWASKVNKNILK